MSLLALSQNPSSVRRTREQMHCFFPEGRRAGFGELNQVEYKVRRAQQQGVGSNDCGAFALAHLTLYCHLVFGSGSQRRDITDVFDHMENVVFETRNFAMRRHLLNCLQANKITPFPTYTC